MSVLHLEAKIVAGSKKVEFVEGSARAKLLALALRSGTVGKYMKAAGKPTGGAANAYLSMFCRLGAVKVVAPAKTKAAAAGK